MSAVQKSLFTWFTHLVFMILFVLRVDDKVDWNWFLIFIPLWILDFTIVIYLTVNVIVHFRSVYNTRVDRNDMTKKRKYALLVCCICKVMFEILLCLYLESFNISLYYVFIPFWMIFTAGIAENFRILMSHHPYR